jgi:hypothetical protein
VGGVMQAFLLRIYKKYFAISVIEEINIKFRQASKIFIYSNEFYAKYGAFKI